MIRYSRKELDHDPIAKLVHEDATSEDDELELVY
jgi:hypothetical protein